MADDQKKSSVNVDAGLSLKAEVKTEVSKESSSRFLDAVTDIFRPFSEGRGLKADQIRLQREDVLIEVAKKAQKRLAFESIEPDPVSNKFMVPFLEKASCENIESELLELWANLLVSEVKTPTALNRSFIEILAKIDSDEAKILNQFYQNTRAFETKKYDSEIKHVLNIIRRIERDIRAIMYLHFEDNNVFAQDWGEEAKPWVSKWVDFGGNKSLAYAANGAHFDQQSALEHLTSLGLLKEIRTIVTHDHTGARINTNFGDSYDVCILLLTDFGASFVAACEGRK